MKFSRGKGAQFETTQQLLLEYTLKRAGNKWQFHKNDSDPWPQIIHGHDYEANLKIDPISGQFFDATSKKLAGKLSKKELEVMHECLLGSKDFKELFQKLLNSTMG